MIEKLDNILNNNTQFIILFIMGLSGLFMFYKLDAQSLWVDEFWTLRRSGQNFLGIIYFQGDIHPPIYFLLLRFWIICFGDSAYAIRALSALIGIFTIPSIYLCGRIFNKRAGLIAAFFLSISPLFIHFCREARMYSLALFFTIISTFLYLKLLKVLKEEEKIDSLFLGYYFLTSVLSIFTHYFSAFILFAHFTHFLMFFDKKGYPILAVQLISASSIMLFAAIILKQISLSNQAPGFTHGFANILTDFGYGFYSFIGGYSTIILDSTFRKNPFNGILNITNIFYLIYSFALFFLIAFNGIKSYRKIFLLPLLQFTMPIIIPLLALPLVSVIGYRYLIFSLPWFLLLTTLILLRKSQWISIVYFMLIIIWSVGIYNLFFNPRYGFPEWREAVRYIEANYNSGDTVIHNRSNKALNYYLQNKAIQIYRNIPTRLQGIQKYKSIEKIIDLNKTHKRMWFIETPDQRIGSYYRKKLSDIFYFELKKEYIRGSGIRIYLVHFNS